MTLEAPNSQWILWVDTVGVAEPCREALTRAGHDVRRGVLPIPEGDRPGLVVSALDTPQTLPALDSGAAGVPVLCLLPPDCEHAAVAAALDAGADAALVQPVTVPILLAWVAAALRRAREAAQQREHEQRLRFLLEATAACTGRLDAEGRLVDIDERWLALTGASREATLGWGWLEALPPEDRRGYLQAWGQARRAGADVRLEYRLRDANGRLRWYEDRVLARRDGSGEVLEWLAVTQDIDARRRGEAEARARVRQQAAVADLGQRALAGAAHRELLEAAADAVATGLEVDCSQVLEYRPDSLRLHLRAGWGWREGLVGKAVLHADESSQVGYTLRIGAPVIVRDLSRDGRFRAPQLYLEHGLVSGLSVVIAGPDGPWGVIAAYTRSLRDFTRDDARFLESLANVLAVVNRRIAAEAQLHEHRRLLDLATRLARLGGWAVDVGEGLVHKGLVHWSQEVADTHGLPAQATLPVEEALEFYAPEWRERIRRSFEACVYRGVPFDEELELIDIHGERHWVRSVGEAVRDEAGAIVRVEGAFQDISAQKRSEEELRRLGERLHNTLESITDAFFILAWDWRFIYVNAQAEHLLQRDRRELLGTVIWEEFPEALGSSFDEQYRRARDSGEPVSFRAYYPPLGRWFDVRAYPTDEGLAVYFQDYTQRHALEQHLRQTQRLEAVGQLTGGVAHDFNNLLTVILGNVEALEEMLAGNPQAVPLLTVLRQASERGAELVHRLLAFARRQPLQPESIPVQSVLQDMEPLLRQALREEVALTVETPEELPTAYVDRSQLEAGLLNLTINARDAIEGTGEVRIRAELVTLEQAPEEPPDAPAPGRYVRLDIADTGTGIAAEDLARVCEPFFSTKGPGQGTGLGLSMVHGFVKQSGGHLSIDSEPGAGTTVRLYLPVAEAAA